jgi:hypothetical protein
MSFLLFLVEVWIAMFSGLAWYWRALSVPIGLSISYALATLGYASGDMWRPNKIEKIIKLKDKD